MKIGCVGLGNMGGIVARIIATKVDDANLLLANRSPKKAQLIADELGGRVVDNQTVFEEADVIVLGVKPSQFSDLLNQYAFILESRPSLLFISMAAGLKLETLGRMSSQHHRWIRVMPNTPLAVGAGVLSYVCSNSVQIEDEALLLDLFSQDATVVKLKEEELDVATAVAGCGPAFVYQFIEAMSDGAVKNGLPRDLALQLASQTVLGAAKMVLETDQHPAALKDNVCSPGGSTIVGIASLEEAAFRGITMSALEASYLRTKELGNKL